VISRSIEITGELRWKARGELKTSGPRELLAKQSFPTAFNPDRSVAADTRFWPDRLPELVPDRLPDEPVVMECDEKVVWGGCVQSHFGHFLTESVARLWPLLPGGELEGLRVVCTGPSWKPYEREWSEAFGVQTITAPKDGIGRFTNVFVPEPAWLLNAWIAPEIRDVHLHARSGMDVPALSPQGVLWLSRSELPREECVYDELLLEWLLREYVTVTHPESRTLVEQIAAIEASDGVAGLVGSAFHTMIAAREPPRCLLLCRNRELWHFVSQDRLLNTNGTFVHAVVATEMHRRRRSGSLGGYRVLIPEALRALNATLLPQLGEDPRISVLMHPEHLVSESARTDQAGDIYTAISKVLLDPHWALARMRLGAMFVDRKLDRCALEQFLIVAELSDKSDELPALYVPARIQAARTLARLGMPEDASEMARQILAVEPDSEEAKIYVPDPEGQARQ